MRYIHVHPVADLISLFTFISGCGSRRNMLLGRAEAVTISLVLHLTANCVNSGPVSIYVKQEAKAQNYVHVNFYNDTFQRLYECMTDENSKCTVKTEYESSGSPFPGLNQKVAFVTSSGIFHLVQSPFTCVYSQSATALECTRNSTVKCRGNGVCTSFRLHNSPICECAYLSWQYPNEKLVFDNKTDNIEYCKQDCTETTTVQGTEPSTETTTAQSTEPSTETTTAQTTEPSSYPSVTSLPSEQASDATTSASNSTVIANFSRDDTSNAVPVIIGVVCGVIFIAVIVIVAGFIYRRKKQTKRQVSNNCITASRTHTSYNNEGLARSNASNIPDVLSTLPYSSHGSETNRESEHGYYTIDKDYGLNRYENGLNTVSLKASQRPAEGVPNSRGLNKYTNALRVSPHTSHIYEDDALNSEVSHPLEGDYSTIETKHDDGEINKAVESVPNSRHLNKYAKELRVSPQTSHTDDGEAVISEMSGALEGDYFTIDTENNGENSKPIESVLNSRHLNKYTNELRVSPQTLHIDESKAGNFETPQAPEGDYFTLETENDFGEDETTSDEEQTIDGAYSLAKDVNIIDEAAVVDVIDVSPPPKNVYSKFADNNNTDMKNPYDMLLEKHQILNSRRTCVD